MKVKKKEENINIRAQHNTRSVPIQHIFPRDKCCYAYRGTM